MASPNSCYGPPESPPFLTGDTSFAQTYHDPANAAVNQQQQRPVTTNNRTHGRRPSPSAGSNTLHTSHFYGQPILGYGPHPEPRQYDRDPIVQNHLVDPSSQRSDVHSPVNILPSGQAPRLVPTQGVSWNQVGGNSQFNGPRDTDAAFNNQPVARGYGTQPRLPLQDGSVRHPAPRSREPSIHVDPSNPQNALNQRIQEGDAQNQLRQDSAADREQQKKEKSRSRKQIEAIGGACTRCHLLKKKCDQKQICSRCEKDARESLPCFRGYKDIWLFWVGSRSLTSASSAGRDLLASIQSAKQQTFACIDEVFPRLVSQISPQEWGLTAVLEFRWGQPMSSATTDLNTTLLNKFSETFTAVPASFEESLLKVVPKPQSWYFPGIEKLPILDSALSMLELVALITSISNAHLYASPVDVFLGKMSLTFVLAYLATAVAERSGLFTYDLMKSVRNIRKGKESNDSNKENEFGTSHWWAIAVYYRVTDQLLNFEPPSDVTEIFARMKQGLASVRERVKHLLEITYHKVGDIFSHSQREVLPGRQDPWDVINRYVPVLPPLEVAFYLKSAAPVSFGRGLTPFDHPRISVKDLLSPGYQRYLERWDLPVSQEVSGNFGALTAANLHIHTIPSAQYQPAQDPIIPGANSDAAAEHGSHTSVQGTEVPPVDEEASTLFGGSDIDELGDHMPQGPTRPDPDDRPERTSFPWFLSHNFDYASEHELFPEFVDLLSGIKPQGEYREPHKRSRSQVSSSSSRSGRSKRMLSRDTPDHYGYPEDLDPLDFSYIGSI
ncbi:hypothetical protein FQN54_000299 [Arachnomyces sp. PD_36]|nr:hypothetical protein FQN54_000299 [Arachnomyces sp. PD_36]